MVYGAFCGYEKSPECRMRLAGGGEGSKQLRHVQPMPWLLHMAFGMKNRNCLSCEAVLTPEEEAREPQQHPVVRQLLWYPCGS